MKESYIYVCMYVCDDVSRGQEKMHVLYHVCL